MSGGGEPLHAVLDRAIREAVAVLDREVKEAFASHELRLPAPPLPPVPPLSGCMRDWTITRWEKDLGPPWPNGERWAPNPLFFPDDYRKAMEYRVERDARRAVIEVLNQWGGGNSSCGTSARTAPGSWCRGTCGVVGFMMLHAHTGRFAPASWHGDLRKYSELKVLQPAPAETPHELEQRPAPPGDDDPTPPRQPRVGAAELERRKNSQARFTPKQREAVLKTFIDSHEGGRDHLFNAYQREIYTTGKGPWLNRKNFLRPALKRKTSVRNKRNPS